LIQSFKELLKERKNLRLILIGSGIKKKELNQMVVKYRLNNYVDFIPYTNNIYSHLSKSSIFVLCSKWEGFGNVVVEALASGTKVIVSNCKGGPKNIIKGHKKAKTFKNNSLNDLTKKIKEIFYVKNQPIKKKLNKYFISYVALKYLNEIKKI
jgi:glycosyltransferase involved in cell wall biosynthesis